MHRISLNCHLLAGAKKNAIELWLIILLRGSNAINSFHTVALVWLIDCQSKIFQHVHTMLLIQQLNSSWLHRMHFTQSTFAHFHAVIGNFIDRSDGFAMVFFWYSAKDRSNGFQHHISFAVRLTCDHKIVAPFGIHYMFGWASSNSVSPRTNRFYHKQLPKKSLVILTCNKCQTQILPHFDHRYTDNYLVNLKKKENLMQKL